MIDNKNVFMARPPSDIFPNGQTLRDHTAGTAEKAYSFGKCFGCGNTAKAVALFHDLGKYTEDFRGVLNNERTHVDHTSSGALVIMKNCDSQILGNVIFAHHSRLLWASKSELAECLIDADATPPPEHRGKTSYSVHSAKELGFACKFWEDDNKEQLTPCPGTPAFRNDPNPSLSKMLYMRMLLSCLVDADYLDAAGEQPDDMELDVDALTDSLSEYREQIKRRSTDNDLLNSLRESVYNDCIAAADSPTGAFTLTAPTGLGKTLSLLAFALRHARANGLRRIIFVLPFLSIIDQNAGVYRSICPDLLEDHSNVRYTEETRRYAERYASPVIVTTSVKFFESLFRSGASDLRRLHQIASSVIVFDESQSLPAELVGATIESVNQLCGRYGCSVVFSSATQPPFELRPNVKWTPREIIRDCQTLYDNTRRCKIDWKLQNETDLYDVARDMSKKRNICIIVNTKKQARTVFEALCGLTGSESCYYLTTELCSLHRTAILDKIKRDPNCRVVSTQCIEAGVDISFSEMYRVLAPFESIIQSAGRVNRGGKASAESSVMHVILPENAAYPDKSYQNAAEAVKLLLSRHDGEIDIQSLSAIREYYEILYLDSHFNCDKSALTKAIRDMNFTAAEDEYRLIDDAGVNVLVPYADMLNEYRAIREEANKTGMTAELMKRAAPLTVHMLDTKSVSDSCPAFTYPPIHGKKVKASCGWYCAEEAAELYDGVTGLLLENKKTDFIF